MNKNDPVLAPVVPVFTRYAVPSVLALLAVSSASVVDGAFVGNYIGPEALAAVNFSMPVVTFFMGVSLMLAIGGSVYVGKQIGEGNSEQANRSFNSVFWFSLTAGLILAALCLSLLTPLIFLLGASGEISEDVASYLGVFLWFAPVWLVSIVLGYMVRIDNQPFLSSSALIIGALSNILFDWLLIVKFEQGLQGAAYATGMSYVVTLLIKSIHFFNKACLFKIQRFYIDLKVMAQVCFNGLSDLANDFSTGFAILIFNWVIMRKLGVEGVAAFSIVNYLIFLGLMMCYGIADAIQPIVSKNFGAGARTRLYQFMRVGSVTALAISLCLAALLLALPDQLIGIFLNEEASNTRAIAQAFLSYVWPVFLFAGINVTIIEYLTAVHQPIPSAIVAMMRCFLLPAALLALLPVYFDIVGIYIALPVAELLCFLLAIYFWHRYRPSRVLAAS